MNRPTPSATDPTSGSRLGRELAQAVAAQDGTRLRGLLATPMVFRAVTPRRFWDAETAVGVADVVLGGWFGPDDRVTGIRRLETDRVGDVEKVSYRLGVVRAGGPSVAEQVAYYAAADGRIVDLRLVCSGFRPDPLL